MPSIRERYAREIIKEHQARAVPPTIPPFPVLSLPTAAHPVKIGILGGGAAGLYAAMILDTFKDYGYTYEILEAEPESDHVGGRLWTFRFSESPNDYYDRGAMRFPKIDFMKRVFDLFERVGIQRDGLLIKYVMSDADNNNILYYNGIRKTEAEYQAQSRGDPFEVGLESSADDYIEGALGPFKDKLKRNFDEGWKYLMQYDTYSTRSYMTSVLKTWTTPSGAVLNYTDQVVTILEMLQSATNLYDCALSESVMDSLDFDNTDNDSWYCIQGGSEEISRRMAQLITPGTLQRGQRVTAIAPTITPSDDTLPGSMLVTVAGDSGTPKVYSHVISTLPLSCLSLVDTSQCGFSRDLSTAIRTLHYDAAVKVAIKFSSRWWEQPPFSQLGGVSSTDRPTRVVIYPSYGIGGTDATIIVSYTWAQDALRFGALARGQNSVAEQALLDVILRDLADMHGNGLTAGSLRILVENYDVWPWYNHEYSAGAFALFGPSQFANLYRNVTMPAANRLYFAGEATSVHHAWLIGALNSAYRCVYQIFAADGRDDLIDILKKNWGTVGEFSGERLAKQILLGRFQWYLLEI